MNVKNISPGVYLKPNIPTLNLLNTYILVFKKVKISSIFDRNLKIGTMKHILLFIMLTTITACLLTSCKSKTTQSATSQSQMSQSQILEVDDILARADSLTGKTFTTEALCTHICAHGGGKIFLMGSDDTKTIRVEAGTKIGSFKPETVNNLVRITGKLVEQRIDEAYLTEWEAQVKAQTAENKKQGEKRLPTASKNGSPISGKGLPTVKPKKAKITCLSITLKEIHTKLSNKLCHKNHILISSVNGAGYFIVTSPFFLPAY